MRDFHRAGACAAAILALVAACSTEPKLEIVTVTFNTGTSEGLADGGAYTDVDAMNSDLYYGDGLAWMPAVEATTRFFAEVQPDIVTFQEIFYAGECEGIPPEAREHFFCQTWNPGDPTVAQVILGEDYQVACNLGKSDKCAAVNRRFGTFRGCDADVCLDGLDGARVEDCGQGSRIGRGLIDLVDGGEMTLVNVHGSSGLTRDEMGCRVRQFDQVFVDLGDGLPAANGDINLVMGDLNTDPGRLVDGDPSAARFRDFVGEGKRFHFISDVGDDAPRSYLGLFDIDHVVSDSFTGNCWVAGVTPDHPRVIEDSYFDHAPVVCSIAR
jgi:hypothetical protein